MRTKIMKGEEAIDYGVRLINSGQVVAFPTETVYGLGADATNEEAVKRIFTAKGRPQDNPLIVHIGQLQDIYNITTNINNDALKLIDAFMPGPLTIVLNKSRLIPDVVTAGLNTVGVRMPANQLARDFINACGVPLAAPSANISAHISPTTAEHVYNDLNTRIPLIIDDGLCQGGIESTVIDLSGDIIAILRPGLITKAMIEAVLGKEVVEYSRVDIKPKSPGMKYKHYSPKKPIEVISSEDDIILRYDELTLTGLQPVIITSNAIKYPNRNTISLGNNAEDIARNIYSAMRKAEISYDYILSEDFSDGMIGNSVMNRLNKAADNK